MCEREGGEGFERESERERERESARACESERVMGVLTALAVYVCV